MSRSSLNSSPAQIIRADKGRRKPCPVTVIKGLRKKDLQLRWGARRKIFLSGSRLHICEVLTVAWKQHPEGTLLEQYQKLEARPWFVPDCFWRSWPFL